MNKDNLSESTWEGAVPSDNFRQLASLSPIENNTELPNIELPNIERAIFLRICKLTDVDDEDHEETQLQVEFTDFVMSLIEQAVVEARIDEAVYILKNGKWINESKGLYCFACNTVSHMNQYKNKVATLCAECGKDFAYYPMIAAQMFIKRRIAQLQANQGASNE